MSSRGVATCTRIAGDRTGDFLDDLTDPDVGKWANEIATVRISRISQIVVKTGAVVDSVTVTYEMTDGSSKTVRHGGTGGNPALTISLTTSQKVIAVYGRRLNTSGLYGQRNIVQLSFIIATKGSGSNQPSVDVQTASAGNVTNANTEFDFSWPLVGLNSYTSQPGGQPVAYLQGLGFSEVLSVAGGTV